MDITSIFKASIKTARLRNPSLPTLDKQRILAKSACSAQSAKSEFTQKTHQIRQQITELRDLLLENRAAYMRFGYHLKSAVQMSDSDRNVIDAESENILGMCTQFIGDLRTECQAGQVLSKQGALHREAVLQLLADYLRAVYRIYQQQKEYRVRHELDTYKLLKLESNKKLIPVIPGRDRVPPPQLAASPVDDGFGLTGESAELNGNSGGVSGLDADTGVDGWDLDDADLDLDAVADGGDQKPASKSTESSVDTQQMPYRSFDEDYGATRSFGLDADEISADDIQMFESENHQLYNELKGLSDEVEQIEKNVVDIAKLQDIFTEKVTMQESDIARIANTVVSATENVKDANEQIKQAIQRNAGLRVYILFFLLVMSFSLLFLDWYND